MGLKIEAKIGGVNITNEHFYLYAIHFFKLFLAFLYAVSIWLCGAMN